MLDIQDDEVIGAIKLRKGGVSVEKNFIVHQECGDKMSEVWILLFSLIAILFFSYPLVWWYKCRHPLGEN